MNCQAILVNFHCSDLICSAVESLRCYPDLRIDVIENSVSPAEATRLKECLPNSVYLTISEKNLGFAGACNLAFELSDTPYVLLLNPDAYLFPGALPRLIKTLEEDAGLAGVSPRVYWDQARKYLMPLSTFPSLRWYVRSQIGRHFHSLLAEAALKQRHEAITGWRATRPFHVEALSGGHVLLRRSAVKQAGGLFDPRFFMYWEDSDLSWRLRHQGFRLVQEPRAEAMHAYTHSPVKDRLIASGWPNFESKYFGGYFWRMLRCLGGLGHAPRLSERYSMLSWPDGDTLDIEISDLSGGEWLLEISPAPDFTPAIGAFGRGRRVSIPASLLQRFSGCQLFLRIGPASAGEQTVGRNFCLSVPEGQ